MAPRRQPQTWNGCVRSFFSEHCKLFILDLHLAIWDGNPHGFSALLIITNLLLPMARAQNTGAAHLHLLVAIGLIARNSIKPKASAAPMIVWRQPLIKDNSRSRRQPPYDIFSAGHYINNQSVGIDINDGVRLNIRPS